MKCKRNVFTGYRDVNTTLRVCTYEHKNNVNYFSLATMNFSSFSSSVYNTNVRNYWVQHHFPLSNQSTLFDTFFLFSKNVLLRGRCYVVISVCLKQNHTFRIENTFCLVHIRFVRTQGMGLIAGWSPGLIYYARADVSVRLGALSERISNCPWL